MRIRINQEPQTVTFTPNIEILSEERLTQLTVTQFKNGKTSFLPDTPQAQTKTYFINMIRSMLKRGSNQATALTILQEILRSFRANN